VFNWIDYVIIAIIVFSTLISIARGFFREALSLLTWIAAFWVGFHFSKNLSLLLQPYLSQNNLRIILAFVLLFILTLIAGSMINFIITRLVSRAGLGGFDRMLGMLFGLGRGILFVAVILLVVHVIVPPQDPLWSRSLLAVYFNPMESYLIRFLPHDLDMQIQKQTTQILMPNAVAPASVSTNAI
jgi:membrane protein required for colicin V production